MNNNFFLSGYVPPLPNLVSCNCNMTNLCFVKDSKCKSNISECSKEDIAKTNYSNGNPNPSNNEYDILESNSKFSGISNNNNTLNNDNKSNEKNKSSFDKFQLNSLFYFVIAAIIITSCICCCIFGCTKGVITVGKLNKKAIIDYNDYIYNNNVVTPMDTVDPCIHSSNKKNSLDTNINLTSIYYNNIYNPLTVSTTLNAPDDIYDPKKLINAFQSSSVNNIDYNHNVPGF